MANQPFSFFGAPFDAGIHADTAQGVDSANGPAKVRQIYHELYENYNIQTYVDDKGDLQPATNDVPGVLDCIEQAVSGAVKAGERFIVFGGSHTITLGTQRGVSKANGPFSLIYFDAHPDMMPEEEIHYGSVMYHSMQEGHLDPNRLAFIGIRHIEDEEQELIDKHKIRCLRTNVYSANNWTERFEKLVSELPPPYVMSIDLDSVDPGMAPGVSSPYPFGLAPRELLHMALSFCGKDLLGFEIVELAPKFDHDNQTARLAAALMHELTRATCEGS